MSRIPLTLALLLLARTAAAAPLGFNDQIRPILVEHCFSCHGADSASRKAELRLDQRDAAVESGAIVPGDPDSSVALDRIFSDDPEEVMPPPATKKVLTAEQKALLKQWIAEGAEYQPHWSFIPPARPEPPPVQNEAWVRNPIDRFILARLEAAGLAPAAEADRRTLARRAALDVTGLPPEPADVEAFVADTRPDAYERSIDALLAKPEWGEHRGRHWLDYARYADTHGIHFDNEREMWAYRQWVIDAFNGNMPFDRFTILQLAGDLVAKEAKEEGAAALEKQIASGFNRCNMTTNEGGVIPEEYIVLYARDRTETTATVWMGMTAGCAVCHDHKFDPLTMKDFYSLSAFFNNTTQGAMDGNVKDTPPVVTVPRTEDRPRFVAIAEELPAARQAVEQRKRSARAEFEAWITALTPESVAAALPQDAPLVGVPLVGAPLTDGAGTTTQITLAGRAGTVALGEKSRWQAGPAGAPALLLDGRAAELPTAGDFEHDQAFSIGFWIRPPANDSSYAIVARMDESAGYRGWDTWVQGRRVAMHLVHMWPDDAFKAIAEAQLPADTWTWVAVTYDGSGKAEGVRVYYDGRPQKLQFENDKFQRHTIRTAVPLTIGSRTPGSPAHGVGLADLAIHGRAFTADEVASLAKTAAVAGMAKAAALADIVKLPPEERVEPAAGLYDWWLASQDDAFRTATDEVGALEAERAEILKRGAVAHVMHEKDEMAKAHVLDRGEYDRRKDEVTADTPAALPAFPESLPRNRLGLAKWLLLQEHPLTSRVTVNRFWQEVFGTGLVRTSGDFGITGELPSHPELLDWLAVEFRESGWDVKKLFRLMLTSAAYRQAAVTTPEKLTRDAANRLLSRGPRFRMDAEMIRDQALAASGLLVRKLGGPSVKPYQPAGVWEAVAMPESNTRSYTPDTGENLYRRSLYWFWKRSAPPTSMDIFNAPSRETCCVKRERTNTPLQALVTLNDPQFVEAARVLADRALAEAGPDDETRVQFMAARILARPLDPDEVAIVRQSLAELLDWYRARPEDARSLVTVGASPPRFGDTAVLAGWTLVANELLNLDEALCK
ncbi:MAG: DUF1553 domain-containing protein [Pirellulales bacterium]